jgi:hypothetical protein
MVPAHTLARAARRALRQVPVDAEPGDYVSTPDGACYIDTRQDSSAYPGDVVATIYLGNILSLSPSGKVYMPWSSNVTEKEAARDERWRYALEKALGKYWLESGEGDLCDLFAVRFLREVSYDG